MKQVISTLFALVFALPVMAQDVAKGLGLGTDLYGGGRDALLVEEGRDDVLLTGVKARLDAPISGTAHLIGRWVEVNAPVAGDVYALGQRVTIKEAVAGDASLAGQRLRIRNTIGGDLRAAGSEITLGADVTGTALIYGEQFHLEGAVTGDVILSVNEVDWGRGARIDGAVIIYEEVMNNIEVPEWVADSKRVLRRGLSGQPLAPDFFGETAKAARRAAGLPKPVPDPEPLPVAYLSFVLILAALAAALAAASPYRLAEMRRIVSQRLLMSGAAGFAGMSALIGAVVILALSVIGLVLAPVMALAGALLWGLGYILGSYAFGTWVMGWFGGGAPVTAGERAMFGGIGALAIGLLGLVPFMGWLMLIALPITGAGGALLFIAGAFQDSRSIT